MPRKIAIQDVIPYIEKKTFTYPREFFLKFKINYKCQCCRRRIRNGTIHLFDSYFLTICPNCGSRLFISVEQLIAKENEYHKKRKQAVTALVTLGCIIFLIIIIKYLL